MRPATPDRISTSAWRAVASRSSAPSRFIWVVMAGKTPCQNDFISRCVFAGLWPAAQGQNDKQSGEVEATEDNLVPTGERGARAPGGTGFPPPGNYSWDVGWATISFPSPRP